MKSTRRRFLKTASLATLASWDAARWLEHQAPWRISDRFYFQLGALLEQHGVPGVAIAAGGPGAPIGEWGLGERESGSGERVDPTTVFAGGSLSKPVLAAVALRLQSSGDFDIDRPLAEMLDSDRPTGEGANEITTRHALQHTTGLTNWRFEAGESLSTLARPGAAWNYSGEGFVLVQRALERMTGTGFEALAQRHVFEPAGMTASTFLWRRDLADRLATPFVPTSNRFFDYAELFRWKDRALVEWAESNGLNPAAVTIDDARDADPEVSALAAELAGRAFPETAAVPNFLLPNAAGSLKTTAGDYLRFMHAWFTDPALSETAFEDPVVRPNYLRWGLGWGMEPAGSHVFWHNGESLGVRTLAIADPRAGGGGQGLVILTNGDEGLRIAKAAVTEVIGKESPIFTSLGL